MIYSVSSTAALSTAIKNASAGDIISLAPGVYSDVAIKSISFSSAVTITSADPGNPAVLVDFSLMSVNNVTLKDLAFKVDSAAALDIGKSQNIIVDNVEVSGRTEDTLGGNGIKVTGSEQIVIKNSDIHHLGNGVSLATSEHITISGNTVENIRVDGIRSSGSSSVEISDNILRTFNRNPGEHGDAIQFFTKNTTGPTHDIRIIDNLIERGDGGRMQGIFMGDESKGKTPYVNVEISGNTLLGAGYNGIAINYVQGAVINDNIVVGYEDQTSWISVTDANGVIMRNNTASSYRDQGNTNFDRIDNIKVDLTSAATDDGYVSSHMLRLFPVIVPIDLGYPPIHLPSSGLGSSVEGWLFG